LPLSAGACPSPLRHSIEKKRGAARLFPHEVQVRNEARHKYKIERTTSDHLTGDPKVAILRVVSVGLHDPRQFGGSKESPASWSVGGAFESTASRGAIARLAQPPDVQE
jgi:hypothetical protein